eukprot:9467056-Pyramimonas_sp.AAC.1
MHPIRAAQVPKGEGQENKRQCADKVYWRVRRQSDRRKRTGRGSAGPAVARRPPTWSSWTRGAAG